MAPLGRVRQRRRLDGGPGSSTIVQYSPGGSVQSTYNIAGSVDGRHLASAKPAVSNMTDTRTAAVSR
jgi:hypothetical protein